MILPTKRLSQDKAMLTLGGEILSLMDEDKTVSRLWSETKLLRAKRPGNHGVTVTYDWFILALTLLYALGAVDAENGRLIKRTK